MWTYRCYINGDAPNAWSAWFNQGSKAFQAKHDVTFRFLEAKTSWRYPEFEPLNDGEGLGEVRFDADNVQWRIFGFFTPGVRHQFTVVDFGTHKAQVYKPKKIIDTSKRKMKEVLADGSKAAFCSRPSRFGGLSR